MAVTAVEVTAVAAVWAVEAVEVAAVVSVEDDKVAALVAIDVVESVVIAGEEAAAVVVAAAVATVVVAGTDVVVSMLHVENSGAFGPAKALHSLESPDRRSQKLFCETSWMNMVAM